VCAAPSFLAEHGKPAAPEDLRRSPCLHYGNLPSGNAWRLKGPDGWKSVRVNGVLCCNNAEVLCQAAVEGLGIALLPTFIAGADLQDGRLVTILNEFVPPHLELHLLYPPSRQLAARVRVLVHFLYDRFGALR
jgi:DNA-binding transcriptional LysR family regulator